MAVKFDSTINLGHVLTFCGFIATGMVTWSTMDKRVTVLEEARNQQAAIDHRQDESLIDLRRTTREDLKEINTKLDKILVAAQAQQYRSSANGR